MNFNAGIGSRKTKIFIIIQIVVSIILLASALTRSINNVSETFDLAKFKSDYAQYNGQELVPIAADRTGDGNPVDYANYRLSNINAGSYTIDIDYETDEDQHCRLSANEQDAYFLHASDFILSHNKTHVSYDFSVSHLTKDFNIGFVNYTRGGTFIIKNVSVSTNGNSARAFLFAWLLVIAVFDYFIFGLKTNDSRIMAAVLAGIAAAASIPLFMRGMNIGHDMTFHLARTEGIADGLRNGEFPVRMNDFFYDGYGYPVDIFYGSVLLYIPAVLRIIGFSITTSYKLYVFAVNLMTAGMAYFCGSNIFKKRSTALVVSLCYTLSSYRLTDMYVRSSAGEYTAMIFLPVIVLAMYKIYTSDSFSWRNSIMLAGGMLGLLYTHVLTTEHVAIILLLSAIVLIRRTVKKNVIRSEITAVIIFLVIGAAFILPFVDYYINTDTIIKYTGQEPLMIQQRGAYISDYFAFFRGLFGNGEGDIGNRMLLSPGLPLMIGLIIGIYMMIAGKADRNIRFFTGLSVLLLFAASDLFPWNIFAKTYPGMILSQIQFPWRYIGFAAPVMAVLTGFVIEKCDEFNIRGVNAAVIAAFACVIAAGSFISNYEEGAGQTVITDTAEMSSYPSNGSEYVIGGSPLNLIDRNIDTKNADASIVSESGVDMVLDVNAYGTSSIDVPRFAYPYYKAYDDIGSQYMLSMGNMNKLRVIISEPYSGKLYIKFSEPWYWRLSEIVSLLGVVLLCLNAVRGYRARRKQAKQ